MASSYFENTERKVATSLAAHSDSTSAFSKELHDLQGCETKSRFQQDMGKLNDDLHKQGLLPGLQIVENEKTNEFELQKIDGAKNQGPADQVTPAPTDSREAPPERPRRGGGGGGGKHHRRKHHRKRHHKHHEGDASDKDDSGTEKDDAPRDDKADKGTPVDRGVHGSDVARDGSNMTKDEKEKYIVGELTKKTADGGLGLTGKQAAGVIGSLEGESPNLFSGRVDHRHEHDLGFVNWIGSRRKELEHFAKQQDKDPTDFKTQVSFMEKELQGSEHKALERLKNTTTVADAAKAFTKGYERPGIPHMQHRVDNAELAFSRMGGWDMTEGSGDVRTA